jgi:hypothetical protein
MTMQARELGFESTLYVNTGTYGSPVWKEIDLARDLTDAQDQAEIDVTTRGVASRGFQAAQAGTTPWGFDFDMLVPAAGESNDAYTALLAALKARTSVDIVHVEGGPIATDGLTAERAVCCVVGGGKGEPLADASTRTLRIRFTPNGDMDNPLQGTTAGGEFVENS